MPKTEDELKALKGRMEALEKELAELSEDELDYIAGGLTGPGTCGYLCRKSAKDIPADEDYEMKTSGVQAAFPYDRTIKPVKN